MTEQQDGEGLMCVRVCVFVLVLRERDGKWRSAVTAGVSSRPKDPQRMLLLL